MTDSIDTIYYRVLAQHLFLHEEDFNVVMQAIHTWGDEKVRTLLRSILMESCSLGSDEANFLVARDRLAEQRLDLGYESEYWRRLAAYKDAVDEVVAAVDFVVEMGSEETEEVVDAVRCISPPWEGITWCLDLIPGSPNNALQVIEAYIRGHLYILPDGRINALEDAAALIRMRYIGLPEHAEDRINLLLERSWRDLEVITAHLYERMGYQAYLTRPQKDGGRDVIAIRDNPGQRDHILIECKRWSYPPRLNDVKALFSGIADKGQRASKVVFVTTSRFTKGEKQLADRNPNLELIEGRPLVLLLNEHLGHDWPLRIESWCSRPVREAESAL